MALVEWSPQYRVNVSAIDQQHQQLVQMLNDLYTAMVERRSAEGVRAALKRMDDYAIEHFSVEERHMFDLRYPERAEHEKQHRRFMHKTQELRDRLATGKLVLSLELISYLRDWLTQHILHTDKRLGAFLNEHGVH